MRPRIEERQQMDFFCTCGRGTELFAVAEISQLMNGKLEKISVRDGKVFFRVQHRIHQENFFLKTILQLKSVERAFVGVFHQPVMKLFSQKQALWKLKSELQLVDATKWKSCYQLWKAIQSAYEPSIPAPLTSIISDKISQGDSNSKQLDTEGDESCRSSVVLLEKRGQKRMRDEVTFRVSAKCSSSAAFWFTPQSLSRVVGCDIAKRNGWTPELRKPELEISVQLNHDGLIVGLPCTRVPLSLRRYMKHPGLRTTISSIMVFLTALEPGMVLLDPMCGMGTILIEAAKHCKDVLCIGCDRDIQQCCRSVENASYSRESARISLMQADVSDIPLADDSVDVVVCDIPFGIKHEAPVNVSEKYRLMILSIDRVLKREGRVVFLCGAKLKDALLTNVTELFSSQTHTSCSPCACHSRTLSVSLQDINSSGKELQTCNSDFTCSTKLESCPSDTLKHACKSNDLKDGSLDCEADRADGVGGGVELCSCGSLEAKAEQFLLRSCCSCPGDISSASSSAFQELTPLNKSTLDTITRLCRRSSNTSANGCRSTVCRSVWVAELVHYVKLGETHAYICVFSTKKIDI